MELASMLAGEPFSDQPRSVSRSIAAFLRAYNDMLDDGRRQDLYAYAAKVVDTSDERTEHERVERLIAWANEMWGQRSRRSLFSRPGRWGSRRKDPEQAARFAIKALGTLTPERHASVLSLIDELIAICAARDLAASSIDFPTAPRPEAAVGDALHDAGVRQST